jgi:hypothetical protein
MMFSISRFSRPTVEQSLMPRATIKSEIHVRPSRYVDHVRLKVWVLCQDGLDLLCRFVENFARWNAVAAGLTGGGGEKFDDIKMKIEFARSMSVTDALDLANLLCYEMNGEPLPPDYGFPVRLIAPGWYGIANVKWLKRIELRDARFIGPFMAQRYVTIREEPSPRQIGHECQ